MTFFNIPKCILNYYTSVKVGSYSIGTLCTGSYSIGTLFFWAKIWRVPILSGHPVYIYIYILYGSIHTAPFCKQSQSWRKMQFSTDRLQETRPHRKRLWGARIMSDSVHTQASLGVRFYPKLMATLHLSGCLRRFHKSHSVRSPGLDAFKRFSLRPHRSSSVNCSWSYCRELLRKLGGKKFAGCFGATKIRA